MRFEDIAVTWKDSLSLLAWKELRLLLLASLNNFRRALKLTIKHFWWLWALWFVALTLPLFFSVILTPHQLFDPIVLEKVPFALPPYRLHDTAWIFGSFMVMTLAFSTIDALIGFTYYLSTRASVEAKNFSYYLRYLPKIAFFFVAQLIIGLGLAPLALIPVLFTSNPSHTAIATSIISMLFSALPLLVGYTFLDLDHAKILHVLKKGFALFIHFFPLIFVFSFFYMVILLLLYGVTILLLACIAIPSVTIAIVFCLFFIQALIISLLQCSCYATLYIKIKHSHPNLFFA